MTAKPVDPEYAIHTRDLSKSFKSPRPFPYLFKRQRIKVLSNINIIIRKGEVHGLIGMNGAGKTTLLRILSTLILPDRGRIRINGYDLWDQKEEVKSQIAFVTGDERGFYWRLSGRENLLFFGALYKYKKGFLQGKVNELLCITDMYDKADREFRSYSSGEKQCLAIARALIGDPEIILIDEFSKSLDVVNTKKIADFIREDLVGKRGKTALVSSHDLTRLQGICDRVTVIHRGCIIRVLERSEFSTRDRTLNKILEEITSYQ